MSNNSIVLTRIDNRLVHGQVGLIWTASVGANLLVVVDDEVAKNPLQKQLMTMTADSNNVGIRFYSIDQAIETLPKASASQKIFLVLPTPEVALKLIQGGINIDKLNVGNMHSSEGKEKFNKRVYLDEQDKTHFKEIIKLGTEVFVQDVPGEPIETFNF